MAPSKKTKSKFIAENESPKKSIKKIKRQSEQNDKTDFVQNITAKEKKRDIKQVSSKITLERVKITMSNLLEKRKEGDEKVLNSLSLLFSQIEADYNAISGNAQKAQQLTENILKFINQTSEAHKQKIESLRDILKHFVQQREEMEQEIQEEHGKLDAELEDDINKLQEKLTAEARRSGWEAMRKSIYQQIHNL